MSPFLPRRRICLSIRCGPKAPPNTGSTLSIVRTHRSGCEVICCRLLSVYYLSPLLLSNCSSITVYTVGLALGSPYSQSRYCSRLRETCGAVLLSLRRGFAVRHTALTKERLLRCGTALTKERVILGSRLSERRASGRTRAISAAAARRYHLFTIYSASSSELSSGPSVQSIHCRG